MRWVLAGITLCLIFPAESYAGMPAQTVTELARFRLSAISFFLALLLLSALAIYLFWNWLRRDFTALPRLSYPKALGVVALWGLLFVLVLTMISGARELMTPGAWVRDGLTYKLANVPGEPEPECEDERRRQLEQLCRALWEYAAGNDGHFPEAPEASDIPADAWRLPYPPGLRYRYVPGRKLRQEPPAVLAYEPQYFPSGRLVLFTSGEVRKLSEADFAWALEGSEK